ncbi:MAG: HEAT repeat domain-containing protein, partial [Candidatus Omnitrophica bacterium]|nr:HEAT repeat domain-containing protein [Candidatus Omnitrophota bacterium]
VVPNLLQTMWGSPTGMAIYEGRLLPERYQDEMVHCDAGPRVVRAYPVKPDGGGYEASIENIVQGNDTWFRPADVCVAPDGSLLVADWYDPGVGGHAMGDHDPSHIRGRIYRIAPKGENWTVPEFDLSTAQSCVETLKSPNMARRYLAWTALHEMKRKAEKPLRKLWRDDNPRYRARALHLLARLKKRGWDYIEEALHDENPDIRIAGLKIVEEERLDPIPFVKMVLDDDSPRVRAEAAIALRHNDSEKAPYYWADLAALHTGKDRWYLESLGIGADGQWDRFFPAWLARVGKGWDTPAGHDIVWRARGEQVPVYLVEILKQTGESYENSARYLRALQFQPEKERNEALVALLEETKKHIGESNGWGRIGVDLVTMFQPSPYSDEQLTDDLGRWLAKAAEGTPQLVGVVETFGLSDLNPMLLDYAIQTSEGQYVASALLPLVLEKDQTTLMTALESEDVTRAVKVVGALGHVENEAAISLLSSIVASTTWATPIRSAALVGLIHTQKGAEEILELAKSGDLPSEFTNLAAIKLNSVPGNWREIREEASNVLPLPSNAEGEVFPAFGELSQMTGDAGHGHEVFKQICMVCHRVKGEGVEFGPDLSNVGGKLGKDALYENILNPNSAISFGYEPITVVLGDEYEEYGFPVEENDQEIVLKVQNGETIRIPKKDIQEIRHEKLSAMPVGLEKGMTTQDFVDL